MKILVISGFLRAGKTTFIQELVRRTGRDFAIYENEYGEADIDAHRLREDSDLRVWESVENCICCIDLLLKTNTHLQERAPAKTIHITIAITNTKISTLRPCLYSMQSFRLLHT